MITLSFAAAMTPAPGSSTGGFSVLLIQIALIGLVFYFLIVRPQAAARRQHEALLQQLKKGDEVTTSGGVIGRVKDIKDDRVTIESGTSTLVIERARIVRVGSAAAPGASG